MMIMIILIKMQQTYIFQKKEYRQTTQTFNNFIFFLILHYKHK